MSTKHTPGTFVISLDLELMWGMFDKVTSTTYGSHLDGVHSVVPKILTLFETYNIHATWAAVGLLTYDSPAAVRTAADAVIPKPLYLRSELSAYEHLVTHDPNLFPKHYCGKDIIDSILNTKHQEFASHTFSHYYCLEEQMSSEHSYAAFAADCTATTAAFAGFDHTPTSIVFPRNQWSIDALATCAEHGFTAFRGTENHELYRARPEREQTNLWLRARRLLDHYINLSGHHTYHLHDVQNPKYALCNIPASRFLRPWSARLRFFEIFRRRRIQNAMLHAAKNGEVFHLWWHPHNFGRDQEANILFLESILSYYHTLHTVYNMQSNTMAELATHANESLESDE